MTHLEGSRLPEARGRISAAVMTTLQTDPAEQGAPSLDEQFPLPIDVVGDADVQLALWTLYELSYQGFADVDDGWEWHPALLPLRRRLEAAFERQLRVEVRPAVDAVDRQTNDVGEQLFALIDQDRGPRLANYLQRHATHDEMLEFLIERSIYHLKESDPHCFVLTRLTGRAKVVLAELQYDEFGGGRPERLHSTLFAKTLESCGLSARYGAYVNVASASTLAVNNAMSLFALNRRLRAADMGHLGAFEATSSLPCRRIAGGLRRLGFGDAAADYFDEHVEADAVHEQLAVRGICAELVAADPNLREDVLFGAAVCLLLDARAGNELLRRWQPQAHSSYSARTQQAVGT
jgi:hypothetical protein